MLEVLQRFSLANLGGVLVVVLILWGIWPVACGVIGSMRGQAFQGVLHGLLWGPIGLPIVLLSGRRYRCPTCGNMSLKQPLGTAQAGAGEHVRPLAIPSPPIPTVVARPLLAEARPDAGQTEAKIETAEDPDLREAVRLYEWVNDVKVPSGK